MCLTETVLKGKRESLCRCVARRVVVIGRLVGDIENNDLKHARGNPMRRGKTLDCRFGIMMLDFPFYPSRIFAASN